MAGRSNLSIYICSLLVVVQFVLVRMKVNNQAFPPGITSSVITLTHHLGTIDRAQSYPKVRMERVELNLA